MSWNDYLLARQYLVETRIGALVRQAKAQEDAAARSAGKTLSRR